MTYLTLGVAALAVVGLVSPTPAPDAVPAPPSASQPHPGESAVGPDFDADGYADLAVGVPGECVECPTGFGGGSVHVVYGGASGLTTERNEVFYPEQAGMVEADRGYEFGSGLAWADFDADGYDDVAVSSPHDSIGGAFDGGTVRVLYGSAAGLTVLRNQLWSLADDGLLGEPEDYDMFGYVIRAGDFNGDGLGDLGVLVSDTLPDGTEHSIRVIYGTSNGLSAEGAEALHTPQGEAISTLRLTAGDLNGDGADELVIGRPSEGGGSVEVRSGSRDGLEDAPAKVWTQDSHHMVGHAKPNEHFGSALDVGDVDGDGYLDLVVGISHDIPPRRQPSTAISVIRGSARGLTATGNQLIRLRPLRGTLEDLGAYLKLAAGDVDGDGYSDLAVGLLDADVPAGDGRLVKMAGAVLVLRAGPDGLDASTAQVWTQESPLIVDRSEFRDSFGGSVALNDYDGDGHTELTISAPSEDAEDVDAGALHVLLGTPDGITALGASFWYLGMAGLPGEPNGFDRLGQAIG